MALPHDKQFHFADGTSAATLDDLKAKIERLSYQEFYSHVNTNKNDFANWVQHVLRDDRLAGDLRKVTSIVETVEILNDHLHPRTFTASQDDVLSRIEQQINIHAIPVEAVDPVIIEDQPSAAAVPKATRQMDFTLIEEKAGIRGLESAPPAQPAPPTHEDTARLIVKDFIYGLLFGLIVGFLLGRIIAF